MSKEPAFFFTWSEDRQFKRAEHIPCKDLKKGIELSLANAGRLTSDAMLLDEKKRTASAVVLLIAAWEEIGKAVLLLKHWINHEDVRGRAWKRIFRSHSAKQTACFDSGDLLWGNKSDAYQRESEELRRKLKSSMRWMKEVGLYVEWTGEEKGWLCPSNAGVAIDIYYLSSAVAGHLDAVKKRVANILSDGTCKLT